MRQPVCAQARNRAQLMVPCPNPKPEKKQDIRNLKRAPMDPFILSGPKREASVNGPWLGTETERAGLEDGFIELT